MTRKKKRFIAGATCPKCKSMDTLMLFMENNVEKVECVNCGHTQTQTDDQATQASKGSANVIGLFKPE
ncbi:YheV family putative zinc ribbon protein [Glaciecola sp. 1036]|uniref:YheV family putative zinc ribbon protein n=1 Tax=Alteromonadaceae TaxID=72275 RepID=UPI003CFE7496